MRKGLITLVLVLLGFSTQAQVSNVFNAISPNLQQFLATHPSANTLLSNTVTSVFTRNAVQLSYYPAVNLAQPKSYYYVTNSVVFILVCQDQPPVDEFISVFFEVKNCQNANRVQDLIAKARAGTINRANYPLEMLKLEFTAMKSTRDALSIFKDPADVANAGTYRSFSKCPDTFEDFLQYVIRVDSGYRNPIEYFEQQYDTLLSDTKVVSL